jgi:hypothetical protein
MVRLLSRKTKHARISLISGSEGYMSPIYKNTIFFNKIAVSVVEALDYIIIMNNSNSMSVLI